MKIEICEECHCQIGISEIAFASKGRVLCEKCYEVINYDYVAISKMRILLFFFIVVNFFVLPIWSFVIQGSVRKYFFRNDFVYWYDYLIASVPFLVFAFVLLMGIELLLLFITLMRAIKFDIGLILIYLFWCYFPIIVIIMCSITTIKYYEMEDWIRNKYLFYIILFYYYGFRITPLLLVSHKAKRILKNAGY